MAELEDVLGANIIPGKRAVHDCGDTGTTQVLATTTEVIYPVDCVTRDYKSGADLWDKATSIITDTVQDSVFMIKWQFTAQSAQAGRKITFRIVIPDAGGDIPVFSTDYFIDTQNVDQTFSNSTVAYNGPEADADGLKVTIEADGSTDLKARSIFVAVI